MENVLLLLFLLRLLLVRLLVGKLATESWAAVQHDRLLLTRSFCAMLSYVCDVICVEVELSFYTATP